MIYTPNLNLQIPEYSDPASIMDALKDNLMRIDETVKELRQENEALRGELGKKVNGAWNIKVTLPQIGIAQGAETIQSIHMNMQNNTTLYFGVDSNSNHTIFPSNFGTVEVIKVHTRRTMWRFYSTGLSNLKLYIGITYEYEHGEFVWSDWHEVSSAIES